MKKSHMVDFYTVNETKNPVKLNLKIGNGHQSNSRVFLNQKTLAGPGPNGSFDGSFEVVLGTNKELNRANLFITTVVSNNSVKAEFISITVRVQGGHHVLEKTLEIPAPAKNQRLCYVVDIDFSR
jgi:hypothetical protein